MSRESNLPSAIGKLFDRRELILALLNGWIWIILFVTVAILMALHDLQHAVPVYQAQMQVTAAQSGGSDTAPRSGIAETLASLTGPSSQDGSSYRFYTDSLTSRDLADALAKNPTIMKTIFANQWDEKTQSWHEPPLGEMDSIKKAIKDYLGLPSAPWQQPDGESLLYFMTSNLQVVGDPRKPYLTKVIFDSADRGFAVYFLNTVNEIDDNILRQKALQRTTQNIAFLSKTLATITIAEHRTALAQALSDQEKSAMVAQSDAPYAAEFFERPWASTLPVYPKPFQDLVSATIYGGFLGCLFAILRWHTKDHMQEWLQRRFARTRRLAARDNL